MASRRSSSVNGAPRDALAAWFAFGVRLFAVALPVAVVVALLAPVDFVGWLAAIALVGSVAGLGMSLAGRRLGEDRGPRPPR